MDKKIHNPPDEIKNIYKWYRKSQVDYTELYIRLYISYNTWFRQVTANTNDREAISMLKKRFIIWDDYCNGRTMQNLCIYVERLVKLSHEQPFTVRAYWDGIIKDVHDWRSLIEFWYQVRCSLVHGSDVPARYVWLAYETLELFMAEIVERMQACFTNKDFKRLEEVSLLARTEMGKDSRFKQLQRKLQAKYIDSPDIWQVDMQRVVAK